jgi:hypothetical protein
VPAYQTENSERSDMSINPIRTIELDHRAFHLRYASRRSLLVVAGIGGPISLVDLATGRTRSLTALPRVGDISPHPSQSWLAVTDEVTGRLLVIDTKGSLLYELMPPELHDVPSKRSPLGFSGCLFGEEADSLWAVAPMSATAVEIQLRLTGDWRIAGQITVEDPYHESSCSLHATSRPDVVALWLAAGQDGQQVYWITRRPGGIDAVREPFLENTIPPAFSPRGGEYVVVEDQGTLCKYPFPTDRKLGTCHAPGGEDEGFAESLCYLDGSNALVMTRDQRVFRVDLQRMKVAGEVLIAGHEPRPTKHYYPRLKEDESLCTDLLSFERCGDVIVFVFRRDRGAGLDGWQDTLLCCAVNDLLKT